MPRLFCHLRYGWPAGKLAIDPEGDEGADVSLLRDHAIQIAGSVVKTRSHAVRDWMECSFEITDENGCAVFTVPFSDSVPDQEER